MNKEMNKLNRSIHYTKWGELEKIMIPYAEKVKNGKMTITEFEHAYKKNLNKLLKESEADEQR
jgi:hypothetical protein